MDSATLAYSILCDDVRLEAGNKLSLMGVFQNVYVPQFPAGVIKFAVVNHWEGHGEFQTEVRILNPHGKETIRSAPGRFAIAKPGPADNITFFTNVSFEEPGDYTLQVYLSGNLVRESTFSVMSMQAPAQTGTVN
jgi:hypothetical protein